MWYVVFTDRAEVCRQVVFEPENEGQHEVWVQGLTNFMNQDSVRVKGTGHCEILEVSFDIHYVIKDEDEESKDENSRKGAIKEFEDKLMSLNEEQEIEQAQIARSGRQLNLLDTYADGMMSPTSSSSSSPGNGPPVSSVKEGDLGYLESVLNFYDEKRDAIDATIRMSNKRIAEISKEVANVSNELYKLRSGGPSENAPSRDVTVVLNVVDPSQPIELELTYLVTNASWSPSYDIRISSDDSTMSLTYFGLVQQATGEDWNVCDVSLSTATPSLGGTPPELPQKQV